MPWRPRKWQRPGGKFDVRASASRVLVADGLLRYAPRIRLQRLFFGRFFPALWFLTRQRPLFVRDRGTFPTWGIFPARLSVAMRTSLGLLGGGPYVLSAQTSSPTGAAPYHAAARSGLQPFAFARSRGLTRSEPPDLPSPSAWQLRPRA